MKEFNMEIKCNKDDSFDHARSVEYSCGCRFTIDANDVYSVNSIDYFGEDGKEYYAICPMCGYINKIDEKLLPHDIKKMADFNSMVEPFLFKKNNLRSELIYLNRISPPYTLKKAK